MSYEYPPPHVQARIAEETMRRIEVKIDSARVYEILSGAVDREHLTPSERVTYDVVLEEAREFGISTPVLASTWGDA